MFTKEEIKERIRECAAQGKPIAGDYNLAAFIAASALIDQHDKAGKPYFHHLIAVSTFKTDSEAKMAIGMLHDVIEDTDWMLDDLREVGFSERVLAGVDGMTRRESEPYFDFIVRGSRNPDSLDVKIKDLSHNLSLFRNNFLLTDRDVERLNRYILSYNYLVAVKKQEVAPGSSFVAWARQQPEKLRDDGLIRQHSSDSGPSSGPAHTPFPPLSP